MFNPDLKEMLKNVNSRYSLVVGTAKRAREIAEEAEKGGAILTEKPVSLAIADIRDGDYRLMAHDDKTDG